MFTLNNTSNPTPEPVSNPAIKDGNVITLFKYNSVSSTLAAQFGIRPIRPDKKGLKILFFKNNLLKKSSPK